MLDAYHGAFQEYLLRLVKLANCYRLPLWTIFPVFSHQKRFVKKCLRHCVQIGFFQKGGLR